MNKKNYAFDIEVFPNFFCATFMNVEDSAEYSSFIIAWKLGIDQSEEMKAFIDNNVLSMIGYNNLYYDYPILEFIYDYNGKDLNKDLFKLSKKIIDGDRGENFGHRKNYRWEQIELMKMMAFDKLGVSLTQSAINLKWGKIQDLPLAYDHNVSKDEIEIIIKYNINDVLITLELYKSLAEEINLRKELSELYKVNLLSASDSKIANILLEKFYTEDSGLNITELRKLRTPREFLWLKNCMCDGIAFKTKKLRELKLELGNTLVVKENNFAYNKTISFGSNYYDLGIGGLHSVDSPGIFESDENYRIIDIDCQSFYPSIMIQNKIKPEHLGDNFINILRDITKQRIEAKKEANTVKAAGLKIVINSIFGKLGSDTFWLYDPKAFLTVTVSGQLFLLMLIEDLVLHGIKVISANTDGIVSKIPADKYETFKKVCMEWETKTGFVLEETEYSKYIRSDVNNYIVKKIDGHIKEKGRYMTSLNLKKGYKYPVVSKAMFEYFINDVPIENTIKNNTDILDFCLSEKTGKDFILEFRDDNQTIPLQKTNRFYISNTGGTLVKIDTNTGKEIGLAVGKLCRILNDYDHTLDFSEYDVNYNYYIEEALKYIESIENSKEEEFFEIEEESSEEERDIFENIETKNINIVSPKFRYSTYAYKFDKNKNCIWRGIGSLKYVTKKVAEDLESLSSKTYIDFIDFLIDVEENTTINSKQMEILIMLDFFSEFGKNGKLMKIYDLFKKGDNKYTKSLKQETKNNRIEAIRKISESLPNNRVSVIDQINFDKSLFGQIQTVYPIQKNYVLITRIDTTYSPKATIYCFNNGNYANLKVRKAIFMGKKFKKDDILFCKKFAKEPSVIKVNNEWVKTGGSEFWLVGYDKVSYEEFDNIISNL